MCSFIWDAQKEKDNIGKHGVDFVTAARAFKDPKRKIFIDSKHSTHEERFFCIGKVDARTLTVRFTYRSDTIRIIGGQETDFEQEVGSMQINHEEVKSAKKSDSVGMKVNEKVHEGYKVYKI